MIGLNLGEFANDRWMIRGQPTEDSESFGSSIVLVLLNQKARRLWQEEETNTNDESPSKLDSDWDTVAAAVVSVCCAVVDDSCKEKPLFVVSKEKSVT